MRLLAYDLLSKLSICGNKRTKALKLQGETGDGFAAGGTSSRFIRGTIAPIIGSSVRIPNIRVRTPRKAGGKIAGKHLVATSQIPRPLQSVRI